MSLWLGPAQVFVEDQADWFLSPHSTPVLLSRTEGPWAGGAGTGSLMMAPGDVQSMITHGKVAWA